MCRNEVGLTTTSRLRGEIDPRAKVQVENPAGPDDPLGSDISTDIRLAQGLSYLVSLRLLGEDR